MQHKHLDAGVTSLQVRHLARDGRAGATERTCPVAARRCSGGDKMTRLITSALRYPRPIACPKQESAAAGSPKKMNRHEQPCHRVGANQRVHRHGRNQDELQAEAQPDAAQDQRERIDDAGEESFFGSAVDIPVPLKRNRRVYPSKLLKITLNVPCVWTRC